MNARVSADDLLFAAEWLDAYDGADEAGNLDANDHAAARVAAWLRAEVARRDQEAAVRRIARATGATQARARAALRARLGRP